VTDELEGLLAKGERAAFHGRPGDGVGPLRRAVEMAHALGRDDEATAATWLLGVNLGASGRYGSALAALAPLLDDPGDVPTRRLFASLAASTSASVHRQLGRHQAARELDERALELAGEAEEAVFDARLGLAADAVGLADVDTARAELATAATLAAGRVDWWRQRVRLNWVRSEIALLGADADEAIAAAEKAVVLAEESGAPRHVAKGLLFLGVSQLQADQAGEAVGTLRRAATLAESLGCLPLLWPSRAMLGAMLAADSSEKAAKPLSGARSAVLSIAEDLPEDLRQGWLGRPDISALLEG
jgi:tetratricopeptide (TPR) repeat protein